MPECIAYASYHYGFLSRLVGLSNYGKQSSAQAHALFVEIGYFRQQAAESDRIVTVTGVPFCRRILLSDSSIGNAQISQSLFSAAGQFRNDFQTLHMT